LEVRYIPSAWLLGSRLQVIVREDRRVGVQRAIRGSGRGSYHFDSPQIQTFMLAYHHWCLLNIITHFELRLSMIDIRYTANGENDCTRKILFMALKLTMK
jgi:hypothetical protein